MGQWRQLRRRRPHTAALGARPASAAAAGLAWGCRALGCRWRPRRHLGLGDDGRLGCCAAAPAGLGGSPPVRVLPPVALGGRGLRRLGVQGAGGGSAVASGGGGASPPSDLRAVALPLCWRRLRAGGGGAVVRRWARLVASGPCAQGGASTDLAAHVWGGFGIGVQRMGRCITKYSEWAEPSARDGFLRSAASKLQAVTICIRDGCGSCQHRGSGVQSWVVSVREGGRESAPSWPSAEGKPSAADLCCAAAASRQCIIPSFREQHPRPHHEGAAINARG